MDFTQTQNIVGWVVGILIMNLISIVAGVYSIYKSIKMTPKELQGVELENKKKEIGIADMYEESAERAVDRLLKVQAHMEEIEASHKDLRISLESQINIQSKRIDSQVINMKEQNDRITNQQEQITQQASLLAEQEIIIQAQGKKIIEQDEIIADLQCELGNARLYNTALIQQLVEANLIPIGTDTLELKDCLAESTKRRGKRNDTK